MPTARRPKSRRSTSRRKASRKFRGVKSKSKSRSKKYRGAFDEGFEPNETNLSSPEKKRLISKRKLPISFTEHDFTVPLLGEFLRNTDLVQFLLSQQPHIVQNGNHRLEVTPPDLNFNLAYPIATPTSLLQLQFQIRTLSFQELENFKSSFGSFENDPLSRLLSEFLSSIDLMEFLLSQKPSELKNEQFTLKVIPPSLQFTLRFRKPRETQQSTPPTETEQWINSVQTFSFEQLKNMQADLTSARPSEQP